MKEIALWKVCRNGNSNPAENMKLDNYIVTLDEISRIIPSGVYTTFRTFDHVNALHLEDHFNRLEESAQLTQKPIKLDRQKLRSAICRSLEMFKAKEARIRLTLDLQQNPGTIYISLETLIPPSEETYKRGISVITYKLGRHNPKAKQTQFIQTSSAARKYLSNKIPEILMVNEHDQILEGLTSNFYGIINGEIFTASEGILLGLTRRMVLEEATLADIPIRHDCIQLPDISKLEEAFITSASRAVMPVIQINDQVIGTGKPGPIADDLLNKYRQRVTKEVEPI